MLIVVEILSIIGLGAAAVAVGYKFITKKSAMSESQMWKILGNHLGLTVAKGPHSNRRIHGTHYMPELYGQLNGQDVYVGIRTYQTGSGNNRTTHYRTYIDVVFSSPLKRGFHIERAGKTRKLLADVFGARDLQTGNGKIDREFRIFGVDSEQIRLLLAGTEELILRKWEKFKITIDDKRVRMETDKRYFSPDLKNAAEHAVVLHAKVLDNWRNLPQSLEEAKIDPAWQQIASRKDMGYSNRRMRMTKKNEDYSLSIESEWEASGWRTRFMVRFTPSLQLALHLKEENVLSKVKKTFGGEDVQVGHRAFDQKFVVKGKDPKRIKEVFTAETCERLLKISEMMDYEVVDEGFSAVAAGLMVDKERLLNTVELMCETAEAMLAHRKPETELPYR